MASIPEEQSISLQFRDIIETLPLLQTIVLTENSFLLNIWISNELRLWKVMVTQKLCF